MILILELLRLIKEGENKMFRPQYNDDYFYITDDVVRGRVLLAMALGKAP